MGDQPAQPVPTTPEVPPLPEIPVMPEMPPTPPTPTLDLPSAMPESTPMITPTTAPAAEIKPEVLNAGGAGVSGSGNKLIMIVSMVALIIVVGIFGAYFYFRSVKSAEEQSVLVAPPVTQVIQTPAPVAPAPEPTITELVSGVDTSMGTLDGDISTVDQGLNDKQGDLKE